MLPRKPIEGGAYTQFFDDVRRRPRSALKAMTEEYLSRVATRDETR